MTNEYLNAIQHTILTAVMLESRIKEKKQIIAAMESSKTIAVMFKDMFDVPARSLTQTIDQPYANHIKEVVLSHNKRQLAALELEFTNITIPTNEQTT